MVQAPPLSKPQPFTISHRGSADMVIRRYIPKYPIIQRQLGERTISTIGEKKWTLERFVMWSLSLPMSSVNHIILYSRVGPFIKPPPLHPSKLGLLELVEKKNRAYGGEGCCLHRWKKSTAIAALPEIQLNSQPKALVLWCFCLGKEGERKFLGLSVTPGFALSFVNTLFMSL